MSVPDRDLLYRVKDLGDAIAATGTEGWRADILGRLIAAADHLGAAQVGVGMAQQLATTDGMNTLIKLFGQGDRALDMAALSLGAVSVHTTIDICATVILIGENLWTPRDSVYEPGVKGLRKRVDEVSAPWQQWLAESTREEYEQVTRWRDPLVHRVLPTGVSGARRDGLLVRESVRVYELGRDGEVVVASAEEMLPRFVGFGEERFLSLCYLLPRVVTAA